MEKVIVGMSGGIDSAMAAYLLKNRGYHVEGLSLLMHDGPAAVLRGDSLACQPESTKAAKAISEILGIHHNVMDVRNEFRGHVIGPFIDGYRQGVTPNPCILCNRHVKFPSLVKKADERGARFIATGHYAVIEYSEISHDQGNSPEREGFLMEATDPSKDQSYVLYVLSRAILRRLLLPLGTMTKQEVREKAEDAGFAFRAARESREICFMEKGGFPRFMRQAAHSGEGPIMDVESGNIVGRHAGIQLYTIGQRKRLIAMGKPYYVVGIDIAKNIVYIGPRNKAFQKTFTVNDINWLNGDTPLTAQFSNQDGLRCAVKVRSTMHAKPARIRKTGDGQVQVTFDVPQWAPAPGQSAVFYDSGRVIGGGIIEKT